MIRNALRYLTRRPSADVRSAWVFAAGGHGMYLRDVTVVGGCITRKG